MGVIEVDFAQDRMREANGADGPFALDGSHVFEIAIVGFEPAPMFIEEAVSVFVARARTAATGAEDETVINLEIGGEENAILVLGEKAADFGGIVPTNFGNPSSEIGHHVRIAIERLFDPIEIFGVVGEMDANEGGFGMTLDDAVERIE